MDTFFLRGYGFGPEDSLDRCTADTISLVRYIYTLKIDGKVISSKYAYSLLLYSLLSLVSLATSDSNCQPASETVANTPTNSRAHRQLVAWFAENIVTEAWFASKHSVRSMVCKYIQLAAWFASTYSVRHMVCK